MSEVVWSFSRLYTYTQCGEKYRRRYPEDDRVSPTLPLIRGGAFANVVRRNHIAQYDQKQKPEFAELTVEMGFRKARDLHLPTVEECRDLAATTFDNLIAKQGVSITRKDLAEYGSEAKARGYNKDFVIRAAVEYRAFVAPKRNPSAVEREVRATIEGLSFVGYLDLVERPGEEDGETEEVVRDQKIGKAPRGNKAASSNQLTTYALLRWAETKRIPRVALDFMVERKDGTVDLVEQESERDATDLRAVLRRYKEAAKGIAAGVFLPTEPGNWWCSARWCEYWSTCPFVNQRRESDGS